MKCETCVYWQNYSNWDSIILKGCGICTQYAKNFDPLPDVRTVIIAHDQGCRNYVQGGDK